ncbi:hypothetical protein DM02DRAFT_544615, partial [Periconia macrospinosa]
KAKNKTYNSRYSLVVTHLTTNPPVLCLSTAERTGSSVFIVLWSYVIINPNGSKYIWHHCSSKRLVFTQVWQFLAPLNRATNIIITHDEGQRTHKRS